MAKSMKLGGGGRFAKLKAKLSAKGAENPGGLAAYIGRKKYGKKKFQKLSEIGQMREYQKKRGL
jgi:hypothetical protein